MGIVTMVRMTRNMPKKLTDATLYSSSMYGVEAMLKGQSHGHNSPRAAISNEDYFIMMKRMNELEEKVNVLSKKPVSMPPEKEEMLNNALKRIDTLEQELLATKKVLTNFSSTCLVCLRGYLVELIIFLKQFIRCLKVYI